MSFWLSVCPSIRTSVCLFSWLYGVPNLLMPPVCHSDCLSVLLSVRLSVFLTVSFCMSVCLSVCLSVDLFVYMSVFLSVVLSFYLSVCLSFCVSLSVCLFVDLFFMSVFPSVFLSVLCQSESLSVRPSSIINGWGTNLTLLEWSSKRGWGLVDKHQTTTKVVSSDKHSSLFLKNVECTKASFNGNGRSSTPFSRKAFGRQTLGRRTFGRQIFGQHNHDPLGWQLIGLPINQMSVSEIVFDQKTCNHCDETIGWMMFGRQSFGQYPYFIGLTVDWSMCWPYVWR